MQTSVVTRSLIVWIVVLRFQPIQCVCTSSLMLILSNTDVTGIDLHHV